MKKFIILLSLIFCLTGSIVSYAGGWTQDSKGWKYIEDNGAMLADTWFQDPSNKCYYHFDSNGYMSTGIVNIDGITFCFTKDGVLQFNGKTSDGRFVDGKGQVIDDVNDGYTFILSSMTENKVGYNRLLVMSIKNECNKPFTIKPTCWILREGQKKTLYLYDTETRTFCNERIIKPDETLTISYVVDSDISEFYVDESSRLQMYFVFNNEDFSCSGKLGIPNRGHYSEETLKNYNIE
ncbi:hypothetical protein [Lacrimispora brassicae]